MLRAHLRLLVASLLIVAGVHPALAAERLKLATTTSTENSGLLRELIPPFEEANDCKVDVIAVGSGKAIKLGMAGDVDVILVHARQKEDAFIAGGYGVSRKDVMYNDFVLIGPAGDPAGAADAEDAAEALKRIASARQTFVSRGDDSGTHTKERALWEAAGTDPAGDWYLEAGRGMGEVITMATERRGYTLSDRGTYIAFLGKSDLVVLAEGDAQLFNPYGVIAVDPQCHPHVNAALAARFIDYLVSEEAQGIIAGFRRNGQNLFFTYPEPE